MPPHRIKKRTSFKSGKEYILAHAVLTREECWEWPTVGRGGYPTTSVDGQTVTLSRYSYEVFKGPIPGDLCVCHHCDNPRCVNPEHLFLGSHGLNMRDEANKGRTLRNHLKEEDVLRIKNLFKTGRHSMGSLAKEFRVTKRAIRQILRGYAWAGVGPDLSYMAYKRGEKITAAKLTEQEVAEIRPLLKVGVGHTEIAEKYGVSRRTIYSIQKGEVYRE